MNKILILSSAVLLSISTLGVAASMSSLSKSQATETFSDKTITTIPLVTLNQQTINNTFTGYFSKDGTMVGRFASKPDNDPQEDKGTWTVKANGTLCATWQHWDQSKPICVGIFKLKNGLLLINADNNKVETLILSDGIKSGNQMN